MWTYICKKRLGILNSVCKWPQAFISYNFQYTPCGLPRLKQPKLYNSRERLYSTHVFPQRGRLQVMLPDRFHLAYFGTVTRQAHSDLDFCVCMYVVDQVTFCNVGCCVYATEVDSFYLVNSWNTLRCEWRVMWTWRRIGSAEMSKGCAV